MRLLAPLIALWLAWPSSSFAQAIVTSAAPDSVSVTVYRNPYRGADSLPDREDDLGGYALITETRTVELPPGEVVIRFEGVASGIQPESAITLGLGVAERNQDRLLLSERGLLDAFTGQVVTLRRTDRATGAVTYERARIRSGPDGAIVVETAAGFEAVQCTGLAETLLYPGVPQTLAAKPVLSVKTRAQAGGRQIVTLSYLADNFDWQANYVGELSPDASRVDLFAWVTLASRDEVSFPDAQTNAVAGRVAREQREEVYDDAEESGVWLQCWPMGRTSDGAYIVPPASPPPSAPLAMRMDAFEFAGGGGDDEGQIIVTGSRIARQEELGDLKLYRIPFPVTVASNSQKQVAFLSKKNVKARLIYRSRVDPWSDGDEIEMLLRIENEKEAGLGEPLPAGQVALFQQAAGLRLLVGEARLDDKAVGEKVDLVFGQPFNVELEEEDLDDGPNWQRSALVASNANPFPIRYEAEFADSDEEKFEDFSHRLERRDGKWVWSVTVPANGKARLRYRKVEIDEED